MSTSADTAIDSATLAALAVRAMQLLGRWNRFVRGFHPFQAGCACCADFGPQSVDDLELSLLCYLSERHPGNEAVAAALRDGAGYKQGAEGSLIRLLQTIGRRALVAPAQAQQLLLDGISGALDMAEENRSDEATS